MEGCEDGPILNTQPHTGRSSSGQSPGCLPASPVKYPVIYQSECCGSVSAKLPLVLSTFFFPGKLEHRGLLFFKLLRRLPLHRTSLKDSRGLMCK